MDIWHRVTFGHKDQVEGLLERLGFHYRTSPLPGKGYLLHIDTVESDPHWLELATLIREKHAVDIFDTTFTREEILNASWLRIQPLFEQGYPQPESTWQEQIYGKSACTKCGVFQDQLERFRLAKEPRMGRNSFMSLYWVYTLFATSEIITAFEAAQFRGYRTREALIHRTNQPSRTVVQLEFPHIAYPGLADEDRLGLVICEQCGTMKYAYHKRGLMRYEHASLRSDLDFQMSHEWFSSGGLHAFREFLVSNRVARLILEQGWHGVAFKPLQLI